MSIAGSLMTAEEFLRLPEDGIQRELIEGTVRERGTTLRDRWHSFVEAQIAFALETWRRTKTPPRGIVLGGKVGIVLFRNPDTIVGIDVAYFSPEVSERDSHWMTLMERPPVLAVEILLHHSPCQDSGFRI